MSGQIPEKYIRTSDGGFSHPARVKRDPATIYGEMAPLEKPSNADLARGPSFSKRIRQSSKPLLNKTEEMFAVVLGYRSIGKVWKQAITLRMDPPYKSYRPDLAYWDCVRVVLVFVEVKGCHRFREKGIAKAALAAKTYPQFRFELAEWTGSEWKESVLSP